MRVVRMAVIVFCLGASGCAGAIVGPRLTAGPPAADALLVLPGFGYGRDGERTFRSLAPSLQRDGIDLYLPTFIARSGLDESRRRLQRFIRDSRLDRYARVHVVAFLAGGWTFNSLDAASIPNLATVVYDRSPYQERAPAVARDTVKLFAWLRYGPVLFDVARTPYPARPMAGVRVGLLVETIPTTFIRRHAAIAERFGPYDFTCGAFGQPYDDCIYVDLDHTGLYQHFDRVWPDVQSFIREGRFTNAASRVAPGRGLEVASISVPREASLELAAAHRGQP